ncbi:MAG: HAD hydrolase-like protein [Pseudomonadota bacterium]
MNDRLAVFDLDGTLVDTAPDLIDTTNEVLRAQGLPPVAPETLRNFIGLGARVMVDSALRAQFDQHDMDLDRLHRDFIAEYKTRLTRRSRPFDEITAALPVLKNAGVELAVCTNKAEGLARQLLSELNLAGSFGTITGGDTFDVSKPHPGHLLKTIDLAGGTPERTVFVGDSRVDFETARAANVPIVGLSYGYSDTPMRDLGPDRLCDPGEDIAAAILALFPEE